MGVIISAEIDGRYVPLTECDWVLWDPCGCPIGVTVGALPDGSMVTASEEAAWAHLYDGGREVARAQDRGEHLEFMTSERYRREVADRLGAPCPHGEGDARG